MNQTMKLLMNRKSIREYDRERPIEDGVRQAILNATMRAPTAGDMMLYSVIEVEDREKKEMLVKTCDDQPFIAKAPMVLLFLADYQRTFDYFQVSDVKSACEKFGVDMRTPEEGDLFIACCDAP